MPGMLNWFFMMIWKKEMKRTDGHWIFFKLGSDWNFSNIDSVFNTGERREPEKFDYKKSKNNLWTPSPTHQTSTLDPTSDKSQGGVQTMPLLPMLEKEARAQFYRDKNMWRDAARDRVLLNHFNNWNNLVHFKKISMVFTYSIWSCL